MNMTKATKMSTDLEAVLPPMPATGKRLPLDMIPEANYSKISERFRKSAPHDFQCAMFCGGKKCKYENSNNWSEHEMALPGIYSHWVTDDILALSRPNMESIMRHNVIGYFREHEIKSLINLQEPNEHANCGNPLTSSGFSYDPTYFMANDVYFYNFQWKDYSIVSQEALLDMVKVMTFAITEGKVAIHCHAGLGRTGVLIAAYLVFTLRCKPQDAIRYVRSKRPQSIQTRGQIVSVINFGQYIVPLFIVFPHILPQQCSLTLNQFLSRQRLLLHGYELRHLKYIPKIIYIICERLLQLCGRRNAYSRGITRQTSINNPENAVNFQLNINEGFCKYFFSSATSCDEFRNERPASNMTIQLSSGIASPETTLTDLSGSSSKSSSNTSRVSTGDSRQITNGTTITYASPYASTSTHNPILPPVEESNDKLSPFSEFEYRNGPLRQIGLVGLETPRRTLSNDNGSDDSYDSTPHDSLTSFFEKTLGYRILQVNTFPSLNGHEMENYENSTNAFDSSVFEDVMALSNESPGNFYNEFDERSLGAPCSSGFMSADCGTDDEYNDIIIDRTRVINALMFDYKLFGPSFMTILYKYQRELNNHQSAWEKLSQETCVEILCSLLWSWIENLKEPVINKNSLCYIVLKAEKPLEALIKLENNARYTFEYLMRFIVRLQPNDESKDYILHQLMSVLTKQCIKTFDGTLVQSNREWNEMRKLTAGRIMLFANGIYQLIEPR